MNPAPPAKSGFSRLIQTPAPSSSAMQCEAAAASVLLEKPCWSSGLPFLGLAVQTSQQQLPFWLIYHICWTEEPGTNHLPQLRPTLRSRSRALSRELPLEVCVAEAPVSANPVLRSVPMWGSEQPFLQLRLHPGRNRSTREPAVHRCAFSLRRVWMCSQHRGALNSNSRNAVLTT